jgi:predicted peptidase
VKPALALIFFCLAMASCKKQDILVKEPEPPQVAPVAPKISMKHKAVSASVGNAVLGYYVGLPSNYEQTNGRYPLLLFISGAGQFGNGASDLPLLLNDGVAQLIDEGKFPSTFKVNGKACIEYAKKTYRVDSTRIYISGLSMGGMLACDLGAEIPAKLAAIVPMAGVSKDYDVVAKSRQIALGNLPVWAFHSADDQVFEVNRVRNFITDINSFRPSVSAKLTVWPTGGHDAWTRALDPAYKEGGLNMYEWMLQFHR